jgi:hypothetical protein
MFDSLWIIFPCHYSRAQCQTQAFLCIAVTTVTDLYWRLTNVTGNVKSGPVHSLLVHWASCGSATHTSSKPFGVTSSSYSNADGYVIIRKFASTNQTARRYITENTNSLRSDDFQSSHTVTYGDEFSAGEDQPLFISQKVRCLVTIGATHRHQGDPIDLRNHGWGVTNSKMISSA